MSKHQSWVALLPVGFVHSLGDGYLLPRCKCKEMGELYCAVRYLRKN